MSTKRSKQIARLKSHKLGHKITVETDKQVAIEAVKELMHSAVRMSSTEYRENLAASLGGDDIIVVTGRSESRGVWLPQSLIEDAEANEMVDAENAAKKAKEQAMSKIQMIERMTSQEDKDEAVRAYTEYREGGELI